MPISFTIPGPPKGFISGAKFWTAKTAPSRLYSKHIREVAANYISLPLQASKDAPIYLDTIAYFPSGVHCEPENVHKLVKDSLFYIEKNPVKKTKRGSDKYTGGMYLDPCYDKENPRVEVTLYTRDEIHLMRMQPPQVPTNLRKKKK